MPRALTFAGGRSVSIWGVGPRIGLIAGAYVAAAAMATHLRPQWFAIPWVPYPVLAAAGASLAAASIAVYVLTARTLLRALREDRLATTGPYAFCRHPLYALWIFLLLPAVGLLLASWLVTTSAVVAYLVARVCVRREDAQLAARFGDEYERYRRRVNQFFPVRGRRPPRDAER
jgi:protein-S-isoprenylcysteine O-methyltransferase Ste14